jgi:hypothetical protein
MCSKDLLRKTDKGFFYKYQTIFLAHLQKEFFVVDTPRCVVYNIVAVKM